MNLKTLIVAPVTGTPITLGVVTYTNGEPSGYTIDNLKLDPAGRRLNIKELPLVTGSLVAPGKLGERDVTVSGMIVGADAQAVRVLRRALINVLKDQGTSFVTLKWTPEATEVAVNGYLNGAVECVSTDSHFLNYQFTVTCPDPIAYQTTQSTQTISGTATQLGNAEVWPTIYVNTTAATVVISNTTTLQTMTLTSMTNGVCLINTKPGYESVTLGGVSILNKLSSASKFVSLIPGANVITVTGGAGLMGWYNGWVD